MTISVIRYAQPILSSPLTKSKRDWEIKMTTNIKYFDRYYVGQRNQDTASGKPLAFAVPDGDDAAAKKRKATVDAWVAGYWSARDTRGRLRKDLKEMGEVYDNKPMTGFRLTDWSDRYITDNKVVRVLDPRGFELEIYIPNLMDIILNSEVDHGEIKDELVWLREGSNNRLVRTSDPAFAEAKQNMVRAAKKKAAPKKSHEVGDIISNTWGTFLYMGLMDVEFVVPRGKRVVDDEMTRQFGTRRVGGFFGFPGNGPIREEVYQTYYRIDDDRLESVSIGRRHVYQDVNRGWNGHVARDTITFRKSKMATQQVVSSNNLLPPVGEESYYHVDYEVFMYYDEDGRLYTQKEHYDLEEDLNKNIQRPNEHKYLEGIRQWKTCVVRVNDGPLETDPVKGRFREELIRGQYH